MDETDFDGTEVLEKIAEIGKIDEFFAAIDADDFGLAKKLMKQAYLDSETINFVLKKMEDGDGGH